MDIISYALSKKGMQQSVSDYLDEHLTNPTNPPLDTSLTIANAAADSKATGDKLSELKEGLNNLKNATTDEKQITENIYGDITWTDGYVTANGTVTTSDTYKYSNKISVTPGDVISLPDTTRYIRWIAAYSDLSTVVEEKGTTLGVTTYTVPDGIKYVVLTIQKSFGTIIINQTESILINNLEEDVEEIKDDLESLENGIGSNKTYVVVNNPTVTVNSGYYWTGAFPSASYYYAHVIGLKQGDIVYLTLTEGVQKLKMRFVDAYLNDNRNASASVNGDTESYTVPSGVDNIYVSFSSGYTANVNVHVKTIETSFVPRTYVDANSFVDNFNLSGNSTYTSSKDLQDICGYRIALFAKVETFTGEIRVGKAETQTYGGAIGFDGTNLYEYLGNISTASRTQAHGLTIKDYIGLIIDLHYDGTTVVTLSTNGGSYTWTIPFWRSQYGQITVYSASALSDCVLSYTCEGILKETWLYGDSYFANTGDVRWTAYLVSKGYSNYLLNAYPGRGSAIAINALKTDLELGKVPKRIVWCLGMNDADSDSQVNDAWVNAVEEVEGICTKNNIELVLATIPNVPSVNNAYKNEYVKISGHRYIPFAKAISADESATWYDGMLETVSGGGYGIHPTTQGALCLFNCAVSAVPELLW